MHTSVESNFPTTLYSSHTHEVRSFALPNLLPEVKYLITLVRLLYWNTILASYVLVPLKPFHSSKLPIFTYLLFYDLTTFLRLVLSLHSLSAIPTCDYIEFKYYRIFYFILFLINFKPF